MIFLFPWWDTLVPWRLSAIYKPQSMVHVPEAEALRRSQELATEQGVTCNAVGTQETEKSFFRWAFRTSNSHLKKGFFPTGILVFSIFRVWVYNLLINSYFLLSFPIISPTHRSIKQVICCPSGFEHCGFGPGPVGIPHSEGCNRTSFTHFFERRETSKNFPSLSTLVRIFVIYGCVGGLVWKRVRPCFQIHKNIF